jgi:hypothetical protein
LWFFDFGNRPTYYCFRFLMATSSVDVNALVSEAIRQAVDNESQADMGIAREIWKQLADLLEEQVLYAMPRNPEFESLPNLGGDYGGPVEDLHNALGAWACCQINFEVVALAVLKALGKWDLDPNEILEIPQKNTDEGEPVAQGRTDPSPPNPPEA